MSLNRLVQGDDAQRLWPLYGYLALVVFISGQRLLELRRSRCHEAWLRKRGGIETAPHHFKAMRCLHIAWLGGCIAEACWRQQAPGLTIMVPAGLLLAIGQILRYAAMSALRERWTVRIITLPGVAPVTDGIYRYLRHPNYLGVVLEMAALPSMFACWLTATVCSIANALILRVRIRAEEAAIEASGGDERALGDNGRCFPASAPCPHNQDELPLP